MIESDLGQGRRRERLLLERWRRAGDQAAREQLLRALLPVAHAAARRYRASGESPDDLAQVASIGALKAIDRFDLERTTSLRAYAERMIEGELRHHMRDGSLLHLPRALYANGRAATRAATRLAVRLGRRPTPEEIASSAGLTTAQVTDGLEALVAADTRSLEALAADEERLDYRERLGADDPRFELVEDRSAFQRVWRTLDPHARACVQMRLAEDRTYREIATRTGISPTHAARLVRRSLVKLRAVAES